MRRAALNQVPDAMFQLGMFFAERWTSKPSRSLAIQWVGAAAALGHVAAKEGADVFIFSRHQLREEPISYKDLTYNNILSSKEMIIDDALFPILCSVFSDYPNIMRPMLSKAIELKCYDALVDMVLLYIKIVQKEQEGSSQFEKEKKIN